MNVPRDVLAWVVDALEAEGLDTAVTGSFALNYYGVVRATHDADVKVALAKDIDERIARAGERLARERMFRIVDDTTFEHRGFTVEVYPARDAIDREAMKRRRSVTLFPGLARRFWIVAPEDLILIKMRAYLEYPASTKHLDDVKLLLAARGDLDVAYLDDRLRRHGFVTTWERAIEGRA
ncbi:MAG TPA: hypothetical protein VM889_04285 [Candidatus Thermoplasmatota archaeon]|nr:hypothetical protein [Candidatus Thermoplasmatota archaeon]